MINTEERLSDGQVGDTLLRKSAAGDSRGGQENAGRRGKERELWTEEKEEVEEGNWREGRKQRRRKNEMVEKILIPNP